MFATSNILTHIDSHKLNPFDMSQHDNELETINFDRDKLNDMFYNSCKSGQFNIA